MISYEPFWNMMKEKGISTYKLNKYYGFSNSLIERLKHNDSITTYTINNLCELFDCGIENIIIYKKVID